MRATRINFFFKLKSIIRLIFHVLIVRSIKMKLYQKIRIRMPHTSRIYTRILLSCQLPPVLCCFYRFMMFCFATCAAIVPSASPGVLEMQRRDEVAPAYLAILFRGRTKLLIAYG